MSVFRALLDLRFQRHMAAFPICTAIVQCYHFFVYTCVLLPFMPALQKQRLTIGVMLTSLSPGLSSFAFISTTGRENQLGRFALADLSNKAFCIGVTRLISHIHNWLHMSHLTRRALCSRQDLASAVIEMLAEPIVLAVLFALVLSLLNIEFSQLLWAGEAMYTLSQVRQ